MADSGDMVNASIHTTRAQRDAWKDEAEEIGMTNKEYYHAMMQSGRREFGLLDNTKESDSNSSTAEDDDNPIQELGLRGRVLRALDDSREEAKGFETVIDEVVDDVENDIGEILAGDSRVEHHPSDGYWVDR